MNVGVLGNASRTPMDGAQNMSFDESTVDGGDTIDGNKGVVSSHKGQDPSDPDVMAALLTRPPVADPCSPTTIRFNEQVTVTKYSPDHSPNALQTLGTAASTSTGNLGGASAAGSTQGDPTLLQGDPSSSQPDDNANSNGDPNSNNSNGNGGSQGGSSTNNDPQGPGPGGSYLDKLRVHLQHYGRTFAKLGH